MGSSQAQRVYVPVLWFWGRRVESARGGGPVKGIQSGGGLIYDATRGPCSHMETRIVLSAVCFQHLHLLLCLFYLPLNTTVATRSSSKRILPSIPIIRGGSATLESKC